MTNPTDRSGPDRAALQQTVIEAILEVAPDVDRERLGPGTDFRDDLGLDSIDALNLATAIGERTGVDIPEVERPRLRTLAALLDFVAARL